MSKRLVNSSHDPLNHLIILMQHNIARNSWDTEKTLGTLINQRIPKEKNRMKYLDLGVDSDYGGPEDFIA